MTEFSGYYGTIRMTGLMRKLDLIRKKLKFHKEEREELKSEKSHSTNKGLDNYYMMSRKESCKRKNCQIGSP